MAKTATIEILERYHLIFKELGIESASTEAGTDLTHLHWMTITSLENSSIWPIDKLSRWLGFIQAGLIFNKITTVSIERDLTRPLFHAEYRNSGIIPPDSRGYDDAIGKENRDGKPQSPL